MTERPRARWGKVVVLLALLGVWAGLAVARWPSRESPVLQAATLGPAVAGRDPAVAQGKLPRLRLDLADLPRRPYPDEFQNIFSAPPPPPPPSPAVVAAPPPVPVQPRPAPPPPDPFAEGAKQLRFLGFLDTGGVRTAMITQGTKLFLVATGELLATRFRVLSVEDDGVLLGSPEGDKQARVPLQGGVAPASGR
jgi:hypothetical protein